MPNIFHNKKIFALYCFRKERERGRERVTKKRWRDETGGRRRLDSEQSGGSTTPSRRTSYQQDEDRVRMSSSETSGRHTPDDFSVSSNTILQEAS